MLKVQIINDQLCQLCMEVSGNNVGSRIAMFLLVLLLSTSNMTHSFHYDKQLPHSGTCLAIAQLAVPIRAFPLRSFHCDVYTAARGSHVAENYT